MDLDKELFKLSQTYLKAQGFDPGPIDGVPGQMTEEALRDYLGQNDSPVITSQVSQWPRRNYASMIDFYGQPGDSSNLVWFTFPYPMRLYDTDAVLTRHSCHKKVAGSLVAVLEEARDKLGIDFIREHKLDRYFGCYMNRPVRGGSQKSTHAWGAAIDINASNNRNRQLWSANKIGQPDYGTMPIEFIEIFERHGWKSGARAWGRDAMHFQATQ